ncbi:CRISPR-associated endonuclease Cas1 [Methylomusa anaerophila]|uniref:CRISPR-associated endonuclease Cas1 n=1 Tax=Methylomusa anaerophila TaxID=1930071 RepID=UPI0018D50EC6|nr:CRISPR-associated endonuclease Cas1 [Methylomusa anaerophila]
MLMAVEGNIREHYYRAFDEIIDDDDFCFEERTRQPLKNYLNTQNLSSTIDSAKKPGDRRQTAWGSVSR